MVISKETVANLKHHVELIVGFIIPWQVMIIHNIDEGRHRVLKVAIRIVEVGLRWRLSPDGKVIQIILIPSEGAISDIG